VTQCSEHRRAPRRGKPQPRGATIVAAEYFFYYFIVRHAPAGSVCRSDSSPRHAHQRPGMQTRSVFVPRLFCGSQTGIGETERKDIRAREVPIFSTSPLSSQTHLSLVRAGNAHTTANSAQGARRARAQRGVRSSKRSGVQSTSRAPRGERPDAR